MRTGLIARKIGMTRVYGGEGEHIPVTVMQIDACQVVGHRTVEKNGYIAMELGVGAAKVKRLAKADRGRFAKANVEPKQKTAEFRVSDDMMVDVGAELSAAHFLVGQKVDVTGTTIGKGFAGAMKRHNFGGLRATHGVSVTHRSHGSTGQRQDPGRVFKNKRMAGHMGDVQCTTQNIEVVRVDEARGLILLKGAVPGSKGGWVMIRDAVREAPPKDLPKPAAIRAQAGASAGEAASVGSSQDTTGAGADQ